MLSILIFKCVGTAMDFLLNKIYTVFSIFKESLLALNQADADFQFLLTSLYSVVKLCDKQNIFESSAKRNGKPLVSDKGKSFM